MLLETRQQIESRQIAARKWVDAYAISIKHVQPTDLAARALMFIVLDKRNSDYLAEHDPTGLKHAHEALSGKSWHDWLNDDDFQNNPY